MSARKVQREKRAKERPSLKTERCGIVTASEKSTPPPSKDFEFPVLARRERISRPMGKEERDLLHDRKGSGCESRKAHTSLQRRVSCSKNRKIAVKVEVEIKEAGAGSLKKGAYRKYSRGGPEGLVALVGLEGGGVTVSISWKTSREAPLEFLARQLA